MELYILDRKKRVRPRQTAAQAWCLAANHLLAKRIAALAKERALVLCRTLFPKEAVAAVPNQLKFLLEEAELKRLLDDQLNSVYIDADDPQMWLDWLMAFKPNTRVKVVARNEKERQLDLLGGARPRAQARLKVISKRESIENQAAHNLFTAQQPQLIPIVRSESTTQSRVDEITIDSSDPFSDDQIRRIIAPWFVNARWLDPLANPSSPAAWRNHPQRRTREDGRSPWTYRDPVELLLDRQTLASIDGLLFNVFAWISFLEERGQKGNLRFVAALIELVARNLTVGSRLCLIGWHLNFDTLSPNAGFTRELCLIASPPDQPAAAITIGRKIWHQETLPIQQSSAVLPKRGNTFHALLNSRGENKSGRRLSVVTNRTYLFVPKSS